MNNVTTATARPTDGPIRLCPRTRWACPLYTNCKTCGGRFARPAARDERLARLIERVRGTDRFRGHAGTAEQNEDRAGLEGILCEALWDECRAAALAAAGDAESWNDPQVRRDAHDLYRDLTANARRAGERGDYERRPVPADPDDVPPPAGGAGGPARVCRGFTTTGGDRRVTVTACGVARDLPPRNDLRDHSPTGLNWGYGGSGPAQLALALLADALGPSPLAACPACLETLVDPWAADCPHSECGEDLWAGPWSVEDRWGRVLRLYRGFASAVVARLGNAGWELTADEVREAAGRLERRP